MLAFAAYTVSGGKPLRVRPSEEMVLNISQVALTPEAMGLDQKKRDAVLLPTVVQISSRDIRGELVKATICTLDSSCRHATVAITLGWDETIEFSLAAGGGAGPVSISGYMQPSPEELSFGPSSMGGYNGVEEDEDEEEEDEEDEDDDDDEEEEEEEEDDDDEDAAAE